MWFENNYRALDTIGIDCEEPYSLGSQRRSVRQLINRSDPLLVQQWVRIVHMWANLP
jgi:hypothetical protein